RSRAPCRSASNRSQGGVLMAGTRSHPHNVALAAVLAVLAGVFTLLYVAHGKGGAHAAVGRTAPTLVATRDIAVGTPASQALASGAIALRRVALAAVGPDSLANARPLAGEVAIQPVYKGEQIVAARFGPSGAVGYRSELRGADRILQVPAIPISCSPGRSRTATTSMSSPPSTRAKR